MKISPSAVGFVLYLSYNISSTKYIPLKNRPHQPEDWDKASRRLFYSSGSNSLLDQRLNRYNKTEITTNYLKLNFNITKKTTNSWKLNNSLLNDHWLKIEIKKEITDLLEFKENGCTSCQNLWILMKVILRGKFIKIML